MKNFLLKVIAASAAAALFSAAYAADAPASAPAAPVQASAAAPAGPALADRHVARGGKCTDCHESAAGGPEKKVKSDYGVCASCHGDYQKMIERTASKHPESAGQPNPHAQHDGALPCTECHKAHQPGKNYCGECHSFVYQVP